MVLICHHYGDISGTCLHGEQSIDQMLLCGLGVLCLYCLVLAEAANPFKLARTVGLVSSHADGRNKYWQWVGCDLMLIMVAVQA